MSDPFLNWLFTSNATAFVCPMWYGSFNWWCKPPDACATEKTSGKQYCCNARGICWSPRSTCSTDGSTFQCTSDNGAYTWCCLKDKEICTQFPGQINICYSTDQDTLNNISIESLNETYSSFSSAAPSASTYAFDPLELIAETQTTATPIPTSPSKSTSSSTASPTTTTAHSNPGTPTALSPGLIAGIVIGAVVVLLALACMVLAVLFRGRRRSARAALVDGAPKPEIDNNDRGHWYPAQNVPREMEGSQAVRASELPAGERYHVGDGTLSLD